MIKTRSTIESSLAQVNFEAYLVKVFPRANRFAINYPPMALVY